MYAPDRHDDLTEGSGEKAAQAPKFRGNVPAVWRVRLPLRRYYLQPAVDRQPGHRWEDSQSKLHTATKATQNCSKMWQNSTNLEISENQGSDRESFLSCAPRSGFSRTCRLRQNHRKDNSHLGKLLPLIAYRRIPSISESKVVRAHICSDWRGRPSLLHRYSSSRTYTGLLCESFLFENL